MNTSLITFLIGIIFPILFAIAGCSMAKKRNRKGWLWFINCWFIGLFGILILAVSGHLKKEVIAHPITNRPAEEVVENDVLGWVILVIGLIVFALQIWYGYEMANARYNQMFWDFHFSL